MTYYSDIKFFNGLPVSSLFCYTALLYLHQCLLHTPYAFCSFSFYALCAMSLQCTIPLLCIAAAAHSSFYTPESLNNNNNNPSLLFSTFLYSLCILCMLSMQWFSCSACRVLCLFIMETLQLLYLLSPSVHHHWVS
jgi:hypothetical protein